MERTEDGGIIIDKTTIDIAKEVLVSIGVVFVMTRVIHYLLSPGYKDNG